MVTPGQIYYYLAAYLSYFALLVCGTDAKTNRDCKPVCSNRCGFCRKSLPAALLQKCFYGVLHEGLEQRTAHPFSTRRKKTLLTTVKYFPLWLVENHVAPNAAHITPASICIVLIIQKVIATVQTSFGLEQTGAPNESIVQNHFNIALLNVFQYLNGRYTHIFTP